MNETVQTLLTRRSIRKFTDRPIDREDLETIARCAIYAPSALNRQTWQFTVLDDTEKIQRLAGIVAKAYGAGEDYDFYRPTAVIIASNQRDNPHGCADCSCGLENIFLAAKALGIGSVWINQLNTTCDDPALRAELTQLGVPEDHRVYGMAALGYPAEEGRPANKNPDAIRFVK